MGKTEKKKDKWVNYIVLVKVLKRKIKKKRDTNNWDGNYNLRKSKISLKR